MKKLSVFIALCIIWSSCTKTVDQFVKIIKEDKNIPVPRKKYKVPVEINLTVVRSEAYLEVKKQEIVTTGGEFYSSDGYTQHQETFRTGGDIDFILTQMSEYDENDERIELGRAVVHIKFNKGVDTKTDISGTGTWSFGKIEGTLKNYLSEGAGVAAYKYDYKIEDDIDYRYPVETVVLKGLMKK